MNCFTFPLFSFDGFIVAYSPLIYNICWLYCRWMTAFRCVQTPGLLFFFLSPWSIKSLIIHIPPCTLITVFNFLIVCLQASRDFISASMVWAKNRNWRWCFSTPGSTSRFLKWLMMVFPCTAIIIRTLMHIRPFLFSSHLSPCEPANLFPLLLAEPCETWAHG